MNIKTYHTMAPVSWLPVGLISWYAPDRQPVALVTSWVAMIGGNQPCIRTAWHGRQDPLARFWAGGDFVYNVPADSSLPALYDFMQTGQLGLHVEDVFVDGCVQADVVRAPLIACCSVQVECTAGQLIESGQDLELVGEVIRLHKGATTCDALKHPDLCGLQPLSPLSERDR